MRYSLATSKLDQRRLARPEFSFDFRNVSLSIDGVEYHRWLREGDLGSGLLYIPRLPNSLHQLAVLYHVGFGGIMQWFMIYTWSSGEHPSLDILEAARVAFVDVVGYYIRTVLSSLV